MNTIRKAWFNLILAPIWFFIIIIIASIYFSASGASETEIPAKITENIPGLILFVQVCILSLLLMTTRKEGFDIFKFGTATGDSKIIKDIIGGILTGACIAILYFYLLSPLQYYLQNSLGDYVPPGETMKALGQQVWPFFIANVILAPFVEESLYRNYALSKFLNKYGQMKSTIFTVIMFGLLHWLGGFWYIVLTALVVGLPFAIITIKRKNIVWVLTAHLTLNLLEFIFILTKA